MKGNLVQNPNADYTNQSVGADFAAHDSLPRTVREWYYTCRLIWAATDATTLKQQGWSDAQVLAWLASKEQEAILEDRLVTWGSNYPRDLLATNHEKDTNHGKANPMLGLRRSRPLVHKPVGRPRHRRRPTDRWGSSGS